MTVKHENALSTKEDIFISINPFLGTEIYPQFKGRLQSQFLKLNKLQLMILTFIIFTVI